MLKYILVFFSSFIFYFLSAQDNSISTGMISSQLNNQPSGNKYANLQSASAKYNSFNNSQLDSTVYQVHDNGTLINDLKYVYEYNASGDQIFKYTYYWWTNEGIWNKGKKEEFQYSSDGLEMLYISMIQVSPDTWQNEKKIEKKYNTDGKITCETQYNCHSSNNEWEPALKKEFEYNSNLNLTLKTNYSWSTSSMNWSLSYKEETEYDENEKETKHTSYGYRNDSWVAQYKGIKEYSEKGELLERHNYRWKTDINDWYEVSAYNFTYNTDGLEVSNQYKIRDENSFDWEFFHKEEKQYDHEGNIIELYLSSKESEDDDWYTSVKFDYEYDSNKNLSKSTRYIWHNGSWAITLYSFQYTYEYDAQNNMIDYTAYRWYEESWLALEKTLNYYTLFTSIKEASNNCIVIYPNPTSNLICVDGTTSSETALISIYDLTGKKIMIKRFVSNEPINIATLKEGIYIYQISIEKDIIDGKIVVKK